MDRAVRRLARAVSPVDRSSHRIPKRGRVISQASQSSQRRPFSREMSALGLNVGNHQDVDADGEEPIYSHAFAAGFSSSLRHKVLDAAVSSSYYAGNVPTPRPKTTARAARSRDGQSAL